MGTSHKLRRAQWPIWLDNFAGRMDRVGNQVALSRDVMRSRTFPVALAYAVVLPVLLTWPASAAAQRRDGGGGEQAVSRPSSPAPAPAPAPAPSPAPAPTSAPVTSSGSS